MSVGSISNPAPNGSWMRVVLQIEARAPIRFSTQSPPVKAWVIHLATLAMAFKVSQDRIIALMMKVFMMSIGALRNPNE